MNLRRKLLVLASLVLPLLTACGQVENTDPNDSLAGQSASVITPPEICPLSVECPEPPTCDPVYDWGCEPCDPTNPAAWCYCEPGLISYSTQVRKGQEPNATPEVNSVAGTHCNRMVITGIGARVVEDSNYATLWVDYRQPYANGTLGPTMRVKTGPQPNDLPERLVTLPDGYVAVGLEVGQSNTHDVKYLKVWAKRLELTSSGVRLTGGYVPFVDGTGVADSGATYFTPTDTQVLVGVGLRSAVEQTKTLVFQVGTLP